MNILRNALRRASCHATAGVAGIQTMWSAYKDEKARCRSIADLEALPRSVLRDIGIRRGEIPVVVVTAIQEQRERNDAASSPPSSGRAANSQSSSNTPASDGQEIISGSPIS